MATLNFTATSTSYSAWLLSMKAKHTKQQVERAVHRAEYWHKLSGQELTEAALDIAKEDSLMQVLALRLEAALERIDELEAE